MHELFMCMTNITMSKIEVYGQNKPLQIEPNTRRKYAMIMFSERENISCFACYTFRKPRCI